MVKIKSGRKHWWNSGTLQQIYQTPTIQVDIEFIMPFAVSVLVISETKQTWELNWCKSSIYIVPLQELLNAGTQSWSWNCTNNCILLLSFFEDHDSGDASYTIFGCDWRTLISIYLVTSELACVFFCEFIDERVDHATWPTPWSPKLNQYREFRVKNERLPCSIGDRKYCNVKEQDKIMLKIIS